MINENANNELTNTDMKYIHIAANEATKSKVLYYNNKEVH